MKISRAIEIVLELAEGNIMDPEVANWNELSDQHDEQCQALDIVRNILGTLPDTDREV